MQLREKKSRKAKKSDISTPKHIKAECEGILKIGNKEISCAVLANGERVLSQRQTLETLGRSSMRGGTPSRAHGVMSILSARGLQPYISDEIRAEAENIIEYQPETGGRTAYGFPARILPMICEVYLNAKSAGALVSSQEAIAERCRILQNGLARVGITALIDEATGYENIRAKKALAEILETYLAKEKQKWHLTFPLDFYKEIYRLREWPWEELKIGIKPTTPSVVGRYTDNFVYKRLAPGILEELRKRNPERTVRHHQWFDPQKGHPKLIAHISGVIATMKLSNSWRECVNNMNRVYPMHWKEGELFYTPSASKKPKVSS